MRSWSTLLPIRHIPSVLLLALALSGCANPALGGGEPDTSRGTSQVVWSQFDQYVRIQPQPSGAPPNDQPVQLGARRIRAALATLAVNREGQDRGLPIFTDHELDRLSAPLATAFAQAGPHQDIAFAVIGMHPGGWTLEHRLTTGLVFYRNETMNLIFGDLHAKYDPDADRRMHPFLPGSRNTVSKGDWSLIATPGVTLERADWLALNLATAVAQGHRAGQEGERVEMRKQMSEMRTELRELKQGESTQAKPTTPAVKEGGTAAGIEDRLRLLRRLHNQGLITDEEYRSKREEILREL